MNGAQANFIVVADGWYENATYLNYSTIPKTLQSYEISSWTGKNYFNNSKNYYDHFAESF